MEYTLKVNIRAQEEKQKREKERQTREAISKLQSTIGPPAKPRKRFGLNFHQPGTFIAKGEQLRKKAKLEALQKRIAAKAEKTGISDAAKIAKLTTNNVDEKKSANELEETAQEEVPEIEWWDKAVVGKHSLDQVVAKLVQKTNKAEDIFQAITNLVEHPTKKQPPGPDLSAVPIPIFLTTAEKKKLRRQNRKNQELEKQEMIKLGLLPKPEPKLKRSNIIYALGDEAITNPSLANQIVREQEEKRLKAHIEHNESKKLTTEEKRAKKLRKFQEDLSITGIWVTVYKINKLIIGSPKLKIIEEHALQLSMTGTICISKNMNLVIVEGGPKQQRKFKHIMNNRIKWSSNQMTILWDGQVTKTTFNSFKIRQFSDDNEARSYFKEFNIEHYWDYAFKTSILESISDR